MQVGLSTAAAVFLAGAARCGHKHPIGGMFDLPSNGPLYSTTPKIVAAIITTQEYFIIAQGHSPSANNERLESCNYLCYCLSTSCGIKQLTYKLKYTSQVEASIYCIYMVIVFFMS